MTCEPAKSVIARLGGLTKVSVLCGVDISTVQRWRMAKDKRGTGGVIPAKYMAVLLRHASATGSDLKASDLIPQAEQARAS